MAARLVGDLSGGLVAALIALPYGLAMASLMGLPASLGILTSIVSAPFIALFGRNPVLIGGTASATVPFVALAVQQHGVAGAAILGILAAVFMIGLSMLRMGRHILRVPGVVVTGFSSGIGVMIVISQLNTILGITPAAGTASIAPMGQLVAVGFGLGDARLAPLILGLSVIVAAAISSRISRYLPSPLIGLLVAVGLAQLLNFRESEVGNLGHVLPTVFQFSWNGMDVVRLVPVALGLAFVVAINLLITSPVVEHVRNPNLAANPADTDAELRAFGIANLALGFFGAPPSVGIPARSVAVVKCGGTTHVANLFHAAVLAAVLWLGSGLVAHIPLAGLAGATIWIGVSLLHGNTWRRLFSMSRIDAAAFLITVFSVLVVNSIVAIFLGCVPYLIRYLRTRGQAAEADSPAGRIVVEEEIMESDAA